MTIDLARYRRVHMVGIAGARMSALARFLLAKGYAVSGSDRSPGKQGDALVQLGARVATGHDGRHVDGADLVVVTPAARDDNPEIVTARQRGIPVVKGSQLLAGIMNRGFGIAVGGTHGKTTTSALIAHILATAGLDPTVLIGGVSANLESNARVGQSALVVVEADEYDGSFLHLQPEIAVITNVVPEHLDYFGSLERVQNAFRQFARAAREALVVCADDDALPMLVRDVRVPVIGYGLRRGDWRARDIIETGAVTEFRVLGPDRGWPVATETVVRTCLAGEHMVLDVLAAIAVSSRLEVPGDKIVQAIGTFAGVARRSERKGDAAGVLVLDDYAVHPNEVRATLAAIGARYRRPLRVIFQPHTYSRVRAFLQDFARSFDGALAVYVMDIYPARETDTLGVHARDISEAVSRFHPRIRYTGSATATLDAVIQDVRPGDAVVTMGAGDVTQLGPRILAALATGSRRAESVEA